MRPVGSMKSKVVVFKNAFNFDEWCITIDAVYIL